MEWREGRRGGGMKLWVSVWVCVCVCVGGGCEGERMKSNGMEGGREGRRNERVG